MSDKKSPTHKVFVVNTNQKESDKKGFWHEIGAGWQNDKGAISIRLSALPVNGELVILPADYEKDPK